jgi:methanogenic corrinoid protein MtbC1
LAHVIRQTPDLLAVGLSAMSSDNLASLADACAAVRRADPEVFVVIGGHAVTGDEHARSLGADAYASSGSDMDALLTDHAAP